MGVNVGVDVGVGVCVGNLVGVGVDVGVKVGVGVATDVNVATGGTGDGDAATARSVAAPPDLLAVHPARHRSRSRTASSRQPRRGREAAVDSGTGMARCATQGGCEDDPGLYAGRSRTGSRYAAGPDRTARPVARTPDSRSARGRRPIEIARKAKHSASHAA